MPIDREEQIMAHFEALDSMLRVAYLSESMARYYRNAGMKAKEEEYLAIAEHAHESAYNSFVMLSR